MKATVVRTACLLAPLLVLLSNADAAGHSQLNDHLSAGKRQTVVVYGTSLTANGAWVSQLQKALNEKYPQLATVINGGKSGMWSKWGVDNLDERVIGKSPDTVLIEFAINDAFVPYKTSVGDARANLVDMIDRIVAAKPGTEVILMTMNPPVGRHLERRPGIKDYYQMYRDVAQDRKLLLIDHDANWQTLLDQEKDLFTKYVPDGIHPGAEGCAAVITPAILQALGIQAEQAAGTASPAR